MLFQKQMVFILARHNVSFDYKEVACILQSDQVDGNEKTLPYTAGIGAIFISCSLLPT